VDCGSDPVKPGLVGRHADSLDWRIQPRHGCRLTAFRRPCCRCRDGGPGQIFPGWRGDLVRLARIWGSAGKHVQAGVSADRQQRRGAAPGLTVGVAWQRVGQCRFGVAGEEETGALLLHRHGAWLTLWQAAPVRIPAMLDAFTAPGRFWRGNLHTHSTRSDGVVKPEEVCRRYRAQGYDFLALTDHFIGAYDYPIVDTVPFRTEGFTTILGAELHSGPMANGELWHILAVGLPPDFTPPDAPDFSVVEGMESGPALAARAVAAGAFVAIAHPQWSGMTLADARSVIAAHAVETYNHGCWAGCDRADGFAINDLLLSEGRRLNLIATDDAHFHEPDHFGGWVMVKSEANTPDALVAALKAGLFYSSQGPEIRSVTLTDNNLEVECSACESVIVQGHGTAARAVHGPSMTGASVALDRFRASPWLRVTVVDGRGKRAWSNPYWR